MRSLLNLFPTHRFLVDQFQHACDARIAAEDRERLWRARAESAEADKEKAQAEKDHALKLASDWLCLVNNMPPIYGVAPVKRIEEDELEPQVPRKRKITDLRAELEAEFYKDMGIQADKEFDSAGLPNQSF